MGVKFWRSWRIFQEFSKIPPWREFLKKWSLICRSQRVFLRANFRVYFFLIIFFFFKGISFITKRVEGRQRGRLSNSNGCYNMGGGHLDFVSRSRVWGSESKFCGVLKLILCPQESILGLQESVLLLCESNMVHCELSLGSQIWDLRVELKSILAAIFYFWELILFL